MRRGALSKKTEKKPFTTHQSSGMLRCVSISQPHGASRARHRALALAGGVGWLLGACAEPDGPPLPEPPDGAELVLQMGQLEVYQAFEGVLCSGTLRRIELHVHGLVELFHIAPPRARVFIYADAEDVDAACNLSYPVWGCASWWGAHSLPAAVTHELVHVFVNESVGHVRTVRLLSEGLAHRLDGDVVVSPARPVEALEKLLTPGRSRDLDVLHSRMFVAWAVEEFGLDAVLDAYVATSSADDHAQVGAELANSLGFASLSDLQAEFDATRALWYPTLPDTTHVFSASDLAEGVAFDTSCQAPFAEGPTEQQATLTARLEILEGGQYEVFHDPIPFPELDLRLVSAEPVHDQDLARVKAQSCPYDVPVPRFVFPVAGQYEVTITRPLEDPVQVPLSVRRIPGDRCTTD
jgi:hypothetical protein